MKNVRYIVVTVVLAVIVSGCSSFQHRDQLQLFNAAYATGDYDKALDAVSFKKSEGKPVNAEAHLLELLHQGEVYRLSGRYQESTEAFDLAEDGMKYLDTQGFIGASAANAMAVMLNDSERSYKALMAEAVLVNTYKGLAFLAAGNNEYARIEFNRADDRTRRAVDFFQQEIVQQQAALNKQAQGRNRDAAAVNDSLENRSLQTAISQNYGEPSNWSVLPEFIVPASTYLHGIYFLANATGNADYERAVTSLTRVAAMNGSNVLQSDARLAQELASGKQTRAGLEPQVWVVYENGLGPALEEIRFEVPLILHRGNENMLAYFGLALPKYRGRPAIPGSVGIMGNTGAPPVQTERISDMGAVIRTEMKARHKGVITRAVSAAVIKAIIQNEMSEQFGPAGQLGALLYTVATTQADLRGWQAMPDHWQAARVSRPESGILTLTDGWGEVLGQVDIPRQPFTLVYIKRPTTLAPATVMVMDLQGNSRATLISLPGHFVPTRVSVLQSPEKGMF